MWDTFFFVTVDGEEREEFANSLRIEQEGIVHSFVEHFFQAHKTLDRAERQDTLIYLA